MATAWTTISTQAGGASLVARSVNRSSGIVLATYAIAPGKTVKIPVHPDNEIRLGDDR